MRRVLVLATTLLFALAGSVSAASHRTTFFDDFNSQSPKWVALYGPGDPGDRTETDMMGDLSQFSVANGVGTIRVERKATPSGRPFAAATIATFGTFGQRYGTFEARIRFQEAKGTWPAMFLLPVGSKSPYPEIDMFEAYGSPECEGPGFLTSATSTSATRNAWKAFIPAASGQWHVHKIVWTRQRVTFYVDGVQTFSTTVSPQVAMYPIIQHGIGANPLDCRSDSTTPDLLTMDIDYVRVTT
jgi:beta-glucanase (GH16 family)